ncbi:hypothetical protein CCH79_00001402 [Gambusia affinis]|uniref:Uncharacterized protein n=1 Tax=Gambusia affinis TaxID=33528 RepID=A0A315VRH3_GAMAF|nr:hypothetical protein CCH79_00001402 [Gambusia affinis]
MPGVVVHFLFLERSVFCLHAHMHSNCGILHFNQTEIWVCKWTRVHCFRPHKSSRKNRTFCTSELEFGIMAEGEEAMSQEDWKERCTVLEALLVKFRVQIVKIRELTADKVGPSLMNALMNEGVSTVTEGLASHEYRKGSKFRRGAGGGSAGRRPASLGRPKPLRGLDLKPLSGDAD